MTGKTTKTENFFYTKNVVFQKKKKKKRSFLNFLTPPFFISEIQKIMKGGRNMIESPHLNMIEFTMKENLNTLKEKNIHKHPSNLIPMVIIMMSPTKEATIITSIDRMEIMVLITTII